MTTWNSQQLATALNVTARRVSQLVESGVLPKPVKGKHDPFTAVPRYLAFLEKRLTGGDLKSARIAKYTVETAIRELDLKQRSGELVLKSAVEGFIFSANRAVRDSLQNIPARVAGICAAEKHQDRVFAVLTKEIDASLEDLCHEHLPANGGRAQPNGSLLARPAPDASAPQERSSNEA